jgi:primosomal protein N' (replication factor Y)
VLVFINRRGYSPTLACTPAAGSRPAATAMRASPCISALAPALPSLRRRCAAAANCPQCGYAVKHVGQGTERVEETLAKLFPDVALARLDRDVVRKRGDMEA